MADNKLKQISVSIENSQKRLYDVTRALGKEKINLRAMNLVDTGDFGLLRLLVSDVPAARRVMMKKQIPARVDEVIAVEIEDKPGSLARVLKFLLDANVKVVYMYALTEFSPATAVMIFRFSDNHKAIKILQKNDIKLLNAKPFGIIK
jgi:hypothetical protein